MTEESTRVQQFEELLGGPVGDHDDVVLLRERLSVQTVEREGWEAVSREIGTTGPATKRCGLSAVVDVGGIAFTDQNGVGTFLLSDFLCERHDIIFEFIGPIVFVATAQSDQPIFLTSRQRIVPVSPTNDVEVAVFSWRVPGGRAEPRVSIDWRCVVPVRTRYRTE